MGMKKYELVIVCDAKTSDQELVKVITEIEENLWTGIRKKDDMWLIDAAYKLLGKKDNLKIHVISYYLELDPKEIAIVSQKMTYMKGVIRYFFYSMTNDQPFWIYKDLVEKLKEKEEEKTESKASEIRKKSDFLAVGDNSSYVTWKSIPLLQKYITRFNNIKPRKFCKHSVRIQKYVRSQIIRAREIGMLPYIR